MRMRLITVSTICLLTVSLAGCLEEDGPSRADLERALGADAILVDEENGTRFFIQPVLEGRFADESGSNPWAATAKVTLEADTVTLNKPPTDTAGGGGVTQALPEPNESFDIEVRFLNHSQLAGWNARWAILHSLSEGLNWSEPMAADQPYTLPAGEPGMYIVLAEILSGSETYATTLIPFVGGINVKWTVESSVHPVKASTSGLAPGTIPNPPNYDEMADEFQITLPSRAATLKADTEFRGDWPGPHGTDVDLQINGPDGSPAACTGVGGSGAGPTGTEPDPAQATETLTISSPNDGAWAVRVGALSTDPSCATDPFYHNANAVPYTLTVELVYIDDGVGLPM